MLDSIRHDLYINLPHPADKSNFEQLFFKLGVASDTGRMPSFEDAGARSGYAVEFFCRARNLADLYMDSWNGDFEFPEYWLEGLRDSPMLGGSGYGDDDGTGDYSMVSLGGGPGFDYVSAAVAASFCSYTSASSTNNDQINLKATILDYEEGWGDLVEAMANSTQTVLQQSNPNPTLQCDWGGKCDITQSIFHPSNTACLSLLNSTNLWVCQYCVAENSHKLQASNYIFFRDLFKHSQLGSMFVLTEVHPWLWPEFCTLVEEECMCMEEVGFNKNGRQMLLRKSCARTEGGDESADSSRRPYISERDQKLLTKFQDLGKYHDRKIDSGWQRQEPKIRGAKVGGTTQPL